MLRYLLRLSAFLSAPRFIGLAHGQPTCGGSSYLSETKNQCFCHGDVDDDPSKIRLAGILDTTTYDWAPDIFALTVKLINEGYWPGTLKEGEVLEYELLNSMCDETMAVQAYWELRTLNNSLPPHGIVGPRCSGACTSLARVSGLEGVPQISPSCNAAQLSDDVEFPFLSRLVPPNDERGQVGALVTLLREYGWSRVTVLATDTIFSKDLATEFREAWVGGQGDWKGGEISYSDTVQLSINRTFDEASAKRVFDRIPTDDPSLNSRIIFLSAHSQHAFEIMETAYRTGFQPDTVWVGPGAWIGKSPEDTDFASWLPGAIGLVPFRNRDSYYQDFLERLQDYQRSNEKPITVELQTFAAETVDSIVALTKAISDNGGDGRRDGRGIVNRLRQLVFGGVSGQVQFTEIGDRKDPRFSILNAQRGGPGGILWKEVGSTGINDGSVNLTEKICFAKFGCVSREDAPSDRYKVPREELPWWVLFLFAVFPLLFLSGLLKYWRSWQSKQLIKEQLEAFREAVVNVRAAEHNYIPHTDKRRGDVEEGLAPGESIDVTEMVVWCWKESKHCMDIHRSNKIFGDPKDCWIKYDKSSNDALEDAYGKKQRKQTIPPGYVVDFESMKQTKIATNFVRDVQRKIVQRKSVIKDGPVRKTKDLNEVKVGDVLPVGLNGEPLMILVKGDLVQISSQRQDGWAFGTKLHHADEATAQELLSMANGVPTVNPVDGQSSILTDTGWFQTRFTRLPSTQEFSSIHKSVGDAGALAPPETWAKTKDPTKVQLEPLKADDDERDAVERAFIATVRPPMLQDLKIIDVKRVQHLAMWQSYVVKRQSICYRETGHITLDDEELQRRALERFERRWLWHGTDADAKDKILQQGLNRSFCGKHGTQYGCGVYLARDAAYAAQPRYATPDRNGYHYVLACRVVVGEYCLGKRDALTPDVRDSASQSLFDTTVDNVSDPTIYVTYHDSQVYPEYLVTFSVN